VRLAPERQDLIDASADHDVAAQEQRDRRGRHAVPPRQVANSLFVYSDPIVMVYLAYFTPPGGKTLVSRLTILARF
jgi:hypothetical protein